MALDYRMDYNITKLYCKDQKVCDTVGQIVRDVAIAYNQELQKGGDGSEFEYGPPPSPEAETMIERIAKLRRSGDGAPDFPRDSSTAMSFSDSDLAIFPIALGGRYYIAALGHDGVGSLEGADTLFAIYDAQGGILVPLAGFVIARSISGLKEAIAEPAEVITGP
jgi:hypothetical protein